MSQELAFLLVGDHLGQVKKVSYPKGKVTLLTDCATSGRDKPVVSIEPITGCNKHLIANQNGELYIYDAIYDTTKACDKADEELIKALPISEKKTLLVYDKKVVLENKKDVVTFGKKGQIKNAKAHSGKIALVGKDIPLRIFDIERKTKLFDAEPPEKDWLGIRPDTYVNGLDFVARTRVATCSKSDSVIRVYDTKSKPSPVISVDLNQTAFNEHADSARFFSVASTGDEGHCIVVGSNVGQIIAIDLRFNVKQVPEKKRLKPKTHKVLGGFKGPRGGSIKDLKIVPCLEEKSGSGDDNEESTSNRTTFGSGYKVISCCLDRYLRIHNFTKTSRNLYKHVYMTTKPLICEPVFYGDNP